MLKATRHDWQTIDNIPSIVFFAPDGTGSETAIAFPIAAFEVLGPQAKARLETAEFAKARVAVPQWHHARFHQVQTAQIGTVETTEPRRVGLILDPDLSSELSLSLSPQDAREIAHRLLTAADQIEQQQSPNQLN